MNGADIILQQLLESGVELCLTNPGTSEMHFVAALDRQSKMKSVLGLFEGVVTGAADGYGRMRGKPAATLLHLGPGLANGLANLHNAKRAQTPIVNIIGEHATYHQALDAPLASDIVGVAATVSRWVETAELNSNLAEMTASAVTNAVQQPGSISSLIIPADVAWQDYADPVPEVVEPATIVRKIDPDRITAVAEAMTKYEKVAMLLGGSGLQEKGLVSAAKVAAVTQCELLSETFSARFNRGAGYVYCERLPYFAEMAVERLQQFDLVVLVGAKEPVAFFAYPGKASELLPQDCRVLSLNTLDQDPELALAALVDELEANSANYVVNEFNPPEVASGELNAITVGQSLAALLPENAIIADEGCTSSIGFDLFCANAAAHDWLALTGGSIGQGLPVATGAALACPDRKVICLEGDGSAMYTIQSLWTQVRESLNVVTIVYANRSYAILNIELDRTGAKALSEQGRQLLNIDNPEMDFVAIARGFGMPAERVTTIERFNTVFKQACAAAGPFLIEVVL